MSHMWVRSGILAVAEVGMIGEQVTSEWSELGTCNNYIQYIVAVLLYTITITKTTTLAVFYMLVIKTNKLTTSWNILANWTKTKLKHYCVVIIITNTRCTTAHMNSFRSYSFLVVPMPVGSSLRSSHDLWLYGLWNTVLAHNYCECCGNIIIN